MPVAILLATALAAGCARAPDTNREPNPLEAPPIDSSRVRSPDEAARWGYRRALNVDLDGDGTEESLVIASDVTLGPRGMPLWEDGHRWAVYVDHPNARTLLYAAFVPNGFVEAAALAPSDTRVRRVLVQERTPTMLRALEVEYEGPGAAKLRSGAHYPLGTWIEGSAVMPEPR